MVTPIRNALPEDVNEEHKEDFGLGVKRARELLEEKEDNKCTSQGEWRYGAVREGFKEQWMEVVLQEENYLLVLKGSSQ